MRAYVGRHTRRVALLAAALFTAVVGIAYATIPDGNGVYTACMLKAVGTVRLIDRSLPSTDLRSHCTSLEAQITWNQQGRAGAQGLPGPKGDTGAAGPQGPQGLKGDAGAQGPAGVQGLKGDTGAQGATGAQGLPGLKGDAGAQGATGPQGSAGPTGASGNDGTSVTSAAEPPGANCANGGSRFTSANGTTYACNGSGAVASALSDLKCTTADGQTNGQVLVSTASDNAITLSCRGSGPCNGNRATLHDDGLGQNFSDCLPGGTVGTSSTFSEQLANDAANAWGRAVGGTVGGVRLLCQYLVATVSTVTSTGGSIADIFENASFEVASTDTLSSLWLYLDQGVGPGIDKAGTVYLQNSATPSCPPGPPNDAFGSFDQTTPPTATWG